MDFFSNTGSVSQLLIMLLIGLRSTSNHDHGRSMKVVRMIMVGPSTEGQFYEFVQRGSNVADQIKPRSEDFSPLFETVFV